MYTGKVENIEELGLEILKAANKYDLEGLKNMCEDFWKTKLNHENVVNVIKVAETYNAFSLKQYCIYFIVNEMIYFRNMDKEESINLIQNLAETHSNIIYELLIVISTKCTFIH